MTEQQMLDKMKQALAGGRENEALELLDAVLRNNPNHAEALYFKAQVFGNMNKFAEAIGLFRQAYRLVNPESESAAEILVSEGEILMEMEKLDEADKNFDRALMILPRLGRIWVHKGRVAARRKDFQSCVQCCERAVALDPQDYRAWNNKAFAYLQLNKPDECIVDAERALQLQPGYSMAWHWLGMAHEMKGNKAKAQECEANFTRLMQGGTVEFTRGHHPGQIAEGGKKKKHWWQS